MNERTSAQVVAGSAVFAALLALWSAPMAAAADIDRRIAECARLSVPSDRLACFDSVAADAAAAADSADAPASAGGRPASTTRPPAVPPPARPRTEPPAPPPPRDEPGTPSAERPAVAVPEAAEPADKSPDASFGAEMLERPEQDERDRAAQQISADLVRLEEQPRGERVFYLSNDQVWVELAPGRGLYREGQTVTVRRALMGGYMLQADGVRAARVRRIR